MLLGEPRNDRLKSAYVRALNILKKMPGDPELVTEKEAPKFSEELAREMAKHPAT